MSKFVLVFFANLIGCVSAPHLITTCSREARAPASQTCEELLVAEDFSALNRIYPKPDIFPLNDSRAEDLGSRADALIRQGMMRAAKSANQELPDFLTEPSSPNSYITKTGKLLTLESVSELAARTQIASFVVMRNKLIWGDSHVRLAQGEPVTSAGEIRVIIGGSPEHVQTVELNLKSGNYRIGAELAGPAIRAAIEAIWAQGIYPETVVIRNLPEQGGGVIHRFWLSDR